MSVVSLREIADGNRDAVLSLRVAPAQARFVSTVAESLGEADRTPEGKPWYRAIYAGDQPVGFVMLSWNVIPDPPRIIGPWFLWKLLIDERHQGHGYGREAVRLVADIAHDHGASALLTSYVVGGGGPEPFYSHLGFVPTGEQDEKGEILAALDLRHRPDARKSPRVSESRHHRTARLWSAEDAASVGSSRSPRWRGLTDDRMRPVDCAVRPA